MGLKAALSTGFLICTTASAMAEDRWIKFAAIMTCNTPRYGNCEALATGDKLTVIGESGSFYQIQSRIGVTYADKNQLDQITTLIDPAIETARERKAAAAAAAKQAAREKASEAERKNRVDAAAIECARRGQPKIGMTPAELTETCWRRPARIVKKTTAAGVAETYVYGIGHVVTVTDGKVSEIVEAR